MKLPTLFLAVLVEISTACAATVVVSMRNFTFQPAQVTVQQGDTVTWTNQDSVLHDSTSGTGGIPNGVWRSPLFSRGGSFSFQFNVQPGSYPYYCTPHVGLGMAGVITVVLPPERPVILTPPVGQVVIVGSTALLSVNASGTPPLSYQWLFEAAPLAGQSSSTLTLHNAQTNQSGNYAAVVSNAGGSVTSAPALLTVRERANTPPVVTIVSPSEGTRIPVTGSVPLLVEPVAVEGVVTQVQFFIGTALLGVSRVAPHTLTLSNLLAGVHSLTAVAQDEFGRRGTSAPISITVFTPETRRPSLRVTTSPPNFARRTTPELSLEGLAFDDTGVDFVEFQVNGGAFERAQGTSVWRADVTLLPGNNIVLVRSVDQAGNLSFPVARYFTLVAEASLTLRVIGNGRVTPNLDGKSLQIGKTYVLQAIPAKRQIFAGWSGSAESFAPRLSFTMEPGLELVATFEPDPFPPVAGAYSGLFFPASGVVPETAGLARLQVTRGGRLTGKLIVGMKSFSFQSQLNPAGSVEIPILRRGMKPLVLHLNLDFASEQIRGTVTDGQWTSDLLANRHAQGSSGQPVTHSGRFPFLISGDTDEGNSVAGEGTLEVSTGGSTKLSGMIEGRKFTFSTGIGRDGTVPFYTTRSPLEMIMGWFAVSQETKEVRGWLIWSKQGPEGFLRELEVSPNNE